MPLTQGWCIPAKRAVAPDDPGTRSACFPHRRVWLCEEAGADRVEVRWYKVPSLLHNHGSNDAGLGQRDPRPSEDGLRVNRCVSERHPQVASNSSASPAGVPAGMAARGPREGEGRGVGRDTRARCECLTAALERRCRGDPSSILPNDSAILKFLEGVFSTFLGAHRLGGYVGSAQDQYVTAFRHTAGKS
jgi:hypothetical protein